MRTHDDRVCRMASRELRHGKNQLYVLLLKGWRVSCCICSWTPALFINGKCIDDLFVICRTSLTNRTWKIRFIDSVREELRFKADGVSWVINGAAFAVLVLKIVGGVHLDARIIGGQIHEDAGSF